MQKTQYIDNQNIESITTKQHPFQLIDNQPAATLLTAEIVRLIGSIVATTSEMSTTIPPRQAENTNPKATNSTKKKGNFRFRDTISPLLPLKNHSKVPKLVFHAPFFPLFETKKTANNSCKNPAFNISTDKGTTQIFSKVLVGTPDAHSKRNQTQKRH